jgi:23S rRNA (cytosine1962-C5)-methyltransferase
MPAIRLKSGRERSLQRRHPWVFSGAVAEVEGEPASGETVEVYAHTGEWIARAAYSPESQIRARVWTWQEGEEVGAAYFERRVSAALAARRPLVDDPAVTAYREVYAESDGLPGLIVDRYNSFRVVQFLTAGAERWREVIVAALKACGSCDGIYERSDVQVRQLEGLPLRTGSLWGAIPDDEMVILEHGLSYEVDVLKGHKTGFYLDQRENRQILRSGLSGASVLNCFAYTGGFTVTALAGGAADVLSIDTSSSALETAGENVALNDLPLGACSWLEGDVFAELRRLRDRGLAFDVIVLDPPRFAATAAQAERAARGYKDINLLAFKLLRPGGRLITFSCSGGVSADLFQKIVAGAALDAGAEASIIGWLGQPSDHPVSLSFPEGRYLKGLICRITGRA